MEIKVLRMAKRRFVSGICVLLLIAFISEGYANDGSALSYSRKVDEFGDITCEDEMARLDAFAVELRNDPNAQAYIIIYGGRRGRRNEAKARAARMKFYLTKIQGLNEKRITTIDGGFREELSCELFITQPGQQPPTPVPTVDLKDVKFKGKVKVRGYNCGAFIG